MVAASGTAEADAVALAHASITPEGSISTHAAVLAAASMSAASAQSSVATSADLASISQLNEPDAPIPSSAQRTVQMIAGSAVDALSPDIPADMVAAEIS